MIKTLSVKNFRLLKNCKFNFSQINLIDGINKDVSDCPANSSGKSTLVQSLLFCLTGDVYKITQKQILHKGTKSAEVTIQAEENGHLYDITRSIPSDLSIKIDGEDFKANTPTLKQPEVDKLYGDKQFIKQFRNMGKDKETDLLAMGPVSIRKVLMGFVDDLFVNARQQLLDELNHREQYSITKRPYCFYLSEKRLQVLKESLTKLKQNQSNLEQITHNQQLLIQNIKTDIAKKELVEKQLNSQIKSNEDSVIKNKTAIDNYKTKIEDINNITLTLPEKINYTEQIESIESDISNFEELIVEIQSEYDVKYNIFEKLRYSQSDLELKIKDSHSKIADCEIEIKTITKAVSGQKCNKCGSLITEDNKSIYIADQQKLIEDYTVQKNGHESNLLDINTKLSEIEKELNTLKSQIQSHNNEISRFRLEVKNITNKNTNQEELINESAQLNTKKIAEIEKYNSLITSLNDTINSLFASNQELENQLKDIPNELMILKEHLIEEESSLSDQIKSNTLVQNKIKRVESFIMKLSESFKFSEYKFTGVDLFEYKESIKLLDNFAAFYVAEFLQNLEIVINGMISIINMSIKFTTDKSFLTIKDGEEEYSYDELSSGQQAVLNIIFKSGVLMTQGIHSGFITSDEALDTLHNTNFIKLVEILKTLPYQYFLVKQNPPELEGVNIIKLVRENGATSVQE